MSSKHRILMVGDEFAIREAFGSVLDGAGYELDVVSTPDDALARLCSETYSGVLFDPGALSQAISAVSEQKGATSEVESMRQALAESEALHQSRLEKLVELERRNEEVYKREHHIAEVLQRALINEIEVNVPGYRIAGKYQAALQDEAEVGGDFYDVFTLSDGRLGLVIGDVSGKGLEAAVHTAMAKYFLRAYAHVHSEPGLVMARLNAALCDSTPEGLFVTVFYGVLDPLTGTLTYANGGHDEPLHYVRATGRAVPLEVTGWAVGVMSGNSYAQGTLDLSPGDVLVMYTDGITNARHNGNFFGIEGLAQVLQNSSDENEVAIVDSIVAAAIQFAHGDLRDDAAMLVLRCEPHYDEHTDR